MIWTNEHNVDIDIGQMWYGPPINDRSSPFNNEHDSYLLNHGMALESWEEI